MRWAGSYGVNYTSNTGFDDGDSYTWNYTGGVDKLFKQPLTGYWRNVFKYFFALSQTGRNGDPPVAPANPDSNFNNGALGIFNSCTTSTQTIVVK
jgi:hypothetical protein